MTASYYILNNPFYKIEQACSNSRSTYIGILRLLQACTNLGTTYIGRSEIRT